MATAYTSILKLALPVQGELSGTWGDVVNDNITSMVEEAIAGRAVINTWTTNSHTLTSADGTTSESRCAMLEFTDTGTALTGDATVVCPTAAKIYICKNDAGQKVTIKTSAGTGVDIADGQTMFVFCDGTNVVEAVTSMSSLKLGTAVTSIEVTSILDEDDLVSDSATALATQQSIKAYVDSQVTAQDLDFAGDTGTGAVDLDSQSLTIAGTSNEIETSAADQTLTIGLPDAVTVTTSVTTPTVQTTNLNANDGTSAVTIADSTGQTTITDAVLTTADINAGTIDNTVIGASTAAAGSFTTVDATGNITSQGQVITDTINEQTATSGVTVDGVLLKDSQVNTDQINEKTADAGVTVDGVLLKDGEVTTDTINEETADAGVTIDSVLLKDDVVNATDIETSTISANDGTTAINIADSTGAVDIDTSLNVDGIITTDGLTSSAAVTIEGAVATINFNETDQTDKNHRIRQNGGNFSIQKMSDDGATVTNNILLSDNGDIFFYDPSGNASFVYDADSDVTINNNQDARDFTVKSDNNASMLYVDGTNDVLGIGTTDNRGFVNIETSAVNYSVGVFSAPHISLQALSQPDDNDGWVGITYATSDSDNYGWSAGAERTTAGNGDFVFTRHSNSETGNERVRFTNGGYVGIGGTPQEMLDLFANNNGATENNTLRFTDTDTVTQSGQNSGTIEFYTSDTDGAGVHATIFAEATGTGGSGSIVAKSGAAGSLVENIRMRGDKTVINDGNADTDFQVKSVNQDNMLFVDASEDKVGIKTNSNLDGTLSIGGTNTTNNQPQSSIVFQDGGSQSQSKIKGYRGSSFQNGAIAFETLQSNTLTEVMKLDEYANVTINSSAAFNTDDTDTSATTQTAVYSFSATDYTGAKFLVCVTDSTATERYITELLVTHDGTTAVATEYGQVATDTALATFDVDISGGNVRLLATPASSNSMTFKVMSTQLLA